LRFGFELVQARSGTEVQHSSLMVLRVPLARTYLHTADRVLRRTLIRFSKMLMAAVAAVNHVCATTEAHHEIEECGEQQE
jgi:hypothetical protein